MLMARLDADVEIFCYNVTFGLFNGISTFVECDFHCSIVSLINKYTPDNSF